MQDRAAIPELVRGLLEHVHAPAGDDHRCPAPDQLGSISTDLKLYYDDVYSLPPAERIAFARRAISLFWQALGIDLQPGFLHDLQKVKSWRTHVTGADLYRQLPVVRESLLPPL